MLIVPTLLLVLGWRRRKLRRTSISSRTRVLLLLLLLLLLLVIRMRHILHLRRRGVNGDQFDGTAVLVDVDGSWGRRGVRVVAVGPSGFGDGDVLDGRWVAVVGLLVVLRVRVRVRLRLSVRRFVFVDDAVAGWGAVLWWCSVDGCRSRGRSWLDVAGVTVVGVVLGVAG
jgi:hypothetical protein